MSQPKMDVSPADGLDPEYSPFEIGASRPVLEPSLLAQIKHLNLDYLELLMAEHARTACATQLQHMSSGPRAAVTAVNARALRLMAAAPYTLFSLGFEDDSLWASISANAPEQSDSSVTRRYARVIDASEQYVFCKLTLLHAWHLATTNPLAARMVYAMPHAAAQRLSATPLWQVRNIASNHASVLMPRWPTNPAFWSGLAGFAAAEDMNRLSTAQLLGVQLIAAELEVACPLSRRDPKAFPVHASPRLRARKGRMR